MLEVKKYAAHCDHSYKDTKLCMPLADRPYNFGTRFHNYLYDELNLDYIYKAFTTNNLKDAIADIRALGIRGCAIFNSLRQRAREKIIIGAEVAVIRGLEQYVKHL